MRLGLNGLQSTEVPNVDLRVANYLSPQLCSSDLSQFGQIATESWSSHFIAHRMTGQHTLKSSDRSRRARASV